VLEAVVAGGPGLSVKSKNQRKYLFSGVFPQIVRHLEAFERLQWTIVVDHRQARNRGKNLTAVVDTDGPPSHGQTRH
jgi:hypothetical protein